MVESPAKREGIVGRSEAETLNEREGGQSRTGKFVTLDLYPFVPQHAKA
jgi:hypothetical protein